MDKVFDLYNHEDFGSLRTLVTEGNILFCVNDVAEALGITDPRGAVKRYCRHIETYSFRMDNGTQVTSFTDIDDILCLISASKSKKADSFKNWLLGEVVPAVFSDAGINTVEDDDDEEEYIITMGDYMARIHLEVALYETLNCLVHGIRNLPDEGINAHALKVFAEKSAELVDGAFFSSGITKEFMTDSNPDNISKLLEETLLIPEDAGYISWRDYEESDPAKFCNGERCCEFADRCEAKYARIANGESVDILDEDADFEYDEYDENEDDMPETGEISTILDCCKHLLTVAGSQLNRLADE